MTTTANGACTRCGCAMHECECNDSGKLIVVPSESAEEIRIHSEYVALLGIESSAREDERYGLAVILDCLVDDLRGGKMTVEEAATDIEMLASLMRATKGLPIGKEGRSMKRKPRA